MDFLRSGHSEPLKAGVHATLGLLALACVAYNGAAWVLRREKHLARNVVIYGALAVLEFTQTQKHLK